MVGIAKKKENSVAVLRWIPANIPPIIVAPERDVPGTIARHCAKPTAKACFQVMVSRVNAVARCEATESSACLAKCGLIMLWVVRKTHLAKHADDSAASKRAPPFIRLTMTWTQGCGVDLGQGI